MSKDRSISIKAALAEAIPQLRKAANAKKCWPCGCLHDSLRAIKRALPLDQRAGELEAALRAGEERLSPVQYDCLGCEVCYPALAVNALTQAGGQFSPEVCPTEKPEERAGWPPFPGTYRVLRYQGSVAICTLTDEDLCAVIAREACPNISIVGTLQTENLGIERLIQNVLANPRIRFVIVCGTDSRKAIGHLPGQSLIALARHGMDNRSRIIGAPGKRPVLRNLSREAVEHFRQTVNVIDLIGATAAPAILDTAQECAARNPGPAPPFAPEHGITPIKGYLPGRMVRDPAGYFVVYVDRGHGLLSLEHYRNDGVLDTVIEGRTAPELYMPAIEMELISRLDHAAYLGKELAKAERALLTGGPYVQDAAPEESDPPVTVDCGGTSSCEETQT